MRLRRLDQVLRRVRPEVGVLVVSQQGYGSGHVPERAEMTCRCGAAAAAAQMWQRAGNNEAHWLLNPTTWAGRLGGPGDTWYWKQEARVHEDKA